MAEKTLNFHKLSDCVINQLKKQNYMDSTLMVYRRIYNRIYSLMKKLGIETYTPEIGRQFLDSVNVCRSTFSAYTCAVRRLNDYIDDIPYRCHHGSQLEKVPEDLSNILNEYLNECSNTGNKSPTILAKKKTCVRFLNCIKQIGCNDIGDLNAGKISQALLIYDNKDNYARIRQFLRYLYDSGLIKTDFSGIVPHYKRRSVLPTTYTPSEIKKVENAIDTATDTGKRDRAIILLATRMGLRSGDIAKLKWSEVDLNSGYIHLRQEKTGIPLSLQMPEAVMAAITTFLESAKSSGRCDEYVFHGMSAPYGRITTSIIRHATDRYFHKAGIDTSRKKHGPHTFRSSLASSMVNDGVSYETVRRILGHSDLNVIKHYAKVDIENLRLCALDPPRPKGIFADYLSGKKVVRHV